ncbi:activating transcription factor 7-interacting protein 2 isoform X2 [Centroberyx affinis]
MERELNYETAIHKLEAHIKRVKRRGDEALAYIMKMGINGTQDTQKKSPLLSPVVPGKLEMSRSDTADEVMETVPHMGNNSMEVNDELVGTMKATKKSLKKMRADKEALKAAIADLSKEPPPPILKHCDSPVSPPCKRPFIVIDQESADHQEEKVEEQKADRVKVEHLPGDSSPEHTDSEKNGLSYPPLPATPFPSVLSMEAASYNIPQRLTLQLALIRNPPGLSVFWNAEEGDPSAPPMDSYSILMTVEKVKGSGVFPDWKTLGEVTAIPLPMCVIISKYKPGYKVCFAVVGKDKFGRYGPYSKVVPATVPD